jgi:hypothetical protein
MTKCINLKMQSESNVIAYQEMTLVMSELINESGEFFQIVSQHI